MKDWKKLEKVAEKTGRSIPSLLISAGRTLCLLYEVRVKGGRVYLYSRKTYGVKELIVKF